MGEPSERIVAAAVALAEANIPPDIQELLIAGDPMRGIAPGALLKAIAAATADLEEKVRLHSADAGIAWGQCEGLRYELEEERKAGWRAGIEAAAKLVERDEFYARIRFDPKRHKSATDWFKEQRAAAIRALAEKENG